MKLSVRLHAFKTKCFLCTLLFFLAGLLPSSAYMVKFKEDYYRLYHIHYQQLPDDCIENIYWLEKAVQADFANPQYARAKITSREDWEKYRYLFMMHINLKLIEQHIRLGRLYDKQVAYFYDAPWKDEYLRDLEKTLACYQAGTYYWQEAKLWAEKANAQEFRWRFLTDIQAWEDESARIADNSLDYEKILNREITRVQSVIDEFSAMESKSY